MQKKIIIVALSLALGVTCASDGQPGISSERPSKGSSKTTELPAAGLVKVADAPGFDSSSVSVQCVDEGFCWINTPRLLWRSVDGGRHWQEIYRAPQDDEIEACDFVRSDTGWLISSRRLLVTNDGGVTWTEKLSPLNHPNGEIRSLWFLNGETGWLAGGIYRPQNAEELKLGVPPNARDVSGKNVLQEAIYRTTDGGNSWEPQSLAGATIGRIMLIRFRNDQRGLALGERAVYLTTNGGKNWREATLELGCVSRRYLSDDYEATPRSVAMLDDMTWWLAYDDGRIVKSGNGGLQWCDLIDPDTVGFETIAGSPTFFKQLHFDSREHGWGLGSDRFFYETKDGGKQWTRVTSQVRFYCMTFMKEDTVLLISESGVFRNQQ